MRTKDTSVPQRARPHQRYYLADGSEVLGVTTVLQVIAKPALIKWANNLGLKGIDSSRYVDEMAVIGTLAHHLIQCDLTGVEPELGDYTPNQIDRAENACLSFYEWERAKHIETVFTERPLTSETYAYGGTPDWYGLIDGKPTLMDMKTGRGIYDDYLYQVAAYHQLVKENGHAVENVRILQVGRDESEGFSEKVIPAPAIAPYFKVFEAALALHRAIKATRRARP